MIKKKVDNRLFHWIRPKALQNSEKDYESSQKNQNRRKCTISTSRFCMSSWINNRCWTLTKDSDLIQWWIIILSQNSITLWLKRASSPVRCTGLAHEVKLKLNTIEKKQITVCASNSYYVIIVIQTNVHVSAITVMLGCVVISIRFAKIRSISRDLICPWWQYSVIHVPPKY